MKAFSARLQFSLLSLLFLLCVAPAHGHDRPPAVPCRLHFPADDGEYARAEAIRCVSLPFSPAVGLKLTGYAVEGRISDEALSVERVAWDGRKGVLEVYLLGTQSQRGDGDLVRFLGRSLGSGWVVRRK